MNLAFANSLKRFSFESPKKKYLQNPIGKRSATSQLATRITANMKLGVPVSASNALSRSYQNGYVNKVSKDPTLTRTMRRASEASPYFKGLNYKYKTAVMTIINTSINASLYSLMVYIHFYFNNHKTSSFCII